jgi:AcrR family transcriptional regulator
VDAARVVFAEKGYGAAGTAEILDRARVARGGMYHHFPTKQALFREVLHLVEYEFIHRLGSEEVPGENVWEQIGYGCQRFLDLALDPEIQRIMLLDGPAVLGWRDWRAVEEKYGFGLLRAYLEQAMFEGLLQHQPVEPLVHLLAGALNEAAMTIANADDRALARNEVGAALDFLLQRLRD